MLLIIKKRVTLIIYVCILLLNSPISLSQERIILEKVGVHKLPRNTIDIIDFNTVVLKEDTQIQIADISDTSNLKLLYEFKMPNGKGYHSIQHRRYIILEDRTKDYFLSVLDIQAGEKIDLEEPNGSTGGVHVAQKDRSILYNVSLKKINKPRLKTKKRPEEDLQVKIINFNGDSEIIVDSVRGSLWAPNEQWFFAAKLIGEKDRSLEWERSIYNRKGIKVSLPSEQSTISGAVWSPNGNFLAIPYLFNSILTIIDFDWSSELPKIKSSVTESSFHPPLLFSPDGKYLMYIKYYEDGHQTFGNDILLTDTSLNLRYPIIEHNNQIEIPILWTESDELITQDGTSVTSSRNMNKYQITIQTEN